MEEGEEAHWDSVEGDGGDEDAGACTGEVDVAEGTFGYGGVVNYEECY